MRTLILIGSLFLLLTTPAAHSTSEVKDAFLNDFPPPNFQVLQAAKLGLDKYRETRRFKNEWSIQIDEQKGVIETNWFPEHKGEVLLKVQIVVWGDSYRVDVWQKVGWFFPSVEKTDRSQRAERHIQDSVKAQLATYASREQTT